MSIQQTTERPIDKAIRIAGNQSKLARLIGGSCKPQNVQYWFSHGRVPPIAALQISRALNNAVTKHELCPEAYPVELTGDAA